MWYRDPITPATVPDERVANARVVAKSKAGDVSRRLASVELQVPCEIARAYPAPTKHGQMRMLEEKHEEVFARGLYAFFCAASLFSGRFNYTL